MAPVTSTRGAGLEACSGAAKLAADDHKEPPDADVPAVSATSLCPCRVFSPRPFDDVFRSGCAASMAVATSISRSCSLHSGTACEAWSLGLSSFGFALSVKLPAVGSRWKPWNADPMGPMGPTEPAPWNPVWTPWNPSNLPCTESWGCSMPGGLICIASQEKLPVGNICPRSPSSSIPRLSFLQCSSESLRALVGVGTDIAPLKRFNPCGCCKPP